MALCGVYVRVCVCACVLVCLQVSLNAWFWSTVFHTRDTFLTEVMCHHAIRICEKECRGALTLDEKSPNQDSALYLLPKVRFTEVKSIFFVFSCRKWTISVLLQSFSTPFTYAV